MTKRERNALQQMCDGSIVVSTASVYDGLRHDGFVEAMGLRMSSRGRSGATFKASWRITANGRAALEAAKEQKR